MASVLLIQQCVIVLVKITQEYITSDTMAVTMYTTDSDNDDDGDDKQKKK